MRRDIEALTTRHGVDWVAQERTPGDREVSSS